MGGLTREIENCLGGPDTDLSLAFVQKKLSEATFADLFDIEEIQKIQDAFAKTAGVASIITGLDGTPITRPSNFCSLCQDIIRKTETGLCNCKRSDAAIGVGRKNGPVVQPCLSGGLWDAGASIYVGDIHLANWLIGQVRNEALSEEKLLGYADVIGADKEEFRKALSQVPVMSQEQFQRISDILFLFANQLSALAYKNFEQKLDIELRKRLEERLTYLALHDHLSGLPNRSLCMDRIEQALYRKRRDAAYNFAVLFVDLDRFKVINDSLGHAVGDVVLQEISQRIAKAVRATDTVARFGGDEFVAVIEGYSSNREVLEVIRRIQHNVKRPLQVGSKRLHCSASVGVHLNPEQGDLPADLIRKANIAMGYAKKMKRGRIKSFSNKLHEQAVYRMDIETDLERGIAENQFYVEYQPIFRNGSGKVYGIEALARWRHPERGLIPPGVFIGIAEETGKIHLLGKLILQQACGFLRRLRDTCPDCADMVLSVNISPVQFVVGDVVADISSVLAAAGIDAKSLRLEITETALLKNQALVMDKIRRLHDMGVQLSIDDFGIGYSNIAMLTRLPLDTLKLDISLVRLVEQGGTNLAVVQSILHMASLLDIGVVAEGVETQEQVDTLTGLGCQLFQGFYYSRPLPEADVPGFLRDYTGRSRT